MKEKFKNDKGKLEENAFYLESEETNRHKNEYFARFYFEI